MNKQELRNINRKIRNLENLTEEQSSTGEFVTEKLEGLSFNYDGELRENGYFLVNIIQSEAVAYDVKELAEDKLYNIISSLKEN